MGITDWVKDYQKKLNPQNQNGISQTAPAEPTKVRIQVRKTTQIRVNESPCKQTNISTGVMLVLKYIVDALFKQSNVDNVDS